MTISRTAHMGRDSLSHLEWVADLPCGGMLLGVHVAEYGLITQEKANDLIDFGSVYVDGRQERNASRLLSGGERIRITWPWQGTKRFYEIDPARIVYRDKWLLVYDKEASVPSQQTPSDGYNNLFAALQRFLEREGERMPYVALHHRLDQDTSGAIAFALDRSANRNLGLAFMHHEVRREYLAWVDGIPAGQEWVSNLDIGRRAGKYRTCPRGEGKPARTSFRALHVEEKENRTLVLAQPHTGRTHQIRLHLAAAGHPVLGDRLYGGRAAQRLHLHAFRLILPHPVQRRDLHITAPLPPDWPGPHGV